MYPDTPISSSATLVLATCKDNAIGSSLNVTCNTDGTFSGSPNCSCAGGHFESGESCYGEITWQGFLLVANFKYVAKVYVRSDNMFKLPCMEY